MIRDHRHLLISTFHQTLEHNKINAYGRGLIRGFNWLFFCVWFTGSTKSTTSPEIVVLLYNLLWLGIPSHLPAPDTYGVHIYVHSPTSLLRQVIVVELLCSARCCSPIKTSFICTSPSPCGCHCKPQFISLPLLSQTL